MPRSGAVVGFDLDMTLVDTMDRVVGTLGTTLAEQGIEVSVAELAPYVGPPLGTTWAELAPDLDPTMLTNRYRALYSGSTMPPSPAMPGAVAALEAVRAAGGRTVVVSAKTVRVVELVLIGAGLRGLVDVVAGDRFGEQKADVLLAESAEAYVGDHPGDIIAARASGAAAVAVATGTWSADRLGLAGADVVLDSLVEFPGWLTSR